MAAGTELGEAHGLTVDWPAFADRWRRDGYIKPIGGICKRSSNPAVQRTGVQVIQHPDVQVIPHS